MRKMVLALAGAVSLMNSCQTMQMTKMTTVGVAAKPGISTTCVIALTNENIEIIGVIDEEVEINADTMKNEIAANFGTIIKRYVYIPDLSGKDKEVALLRNQNPVYFDTALQKIVAECMDKYPGMDYILFPKIQIETKGKRTMIASSIERYRMRLTGKAIRISIGD